MTSETLYAYLDAVSDREAGILRELRLETLPDVDSEMAVSPMEGQFLSVLVSAMRACKICEIGVYTGYSTLCMARALPDDGHIWAFDVNESTATTARKFWRKAEVDDRITLWIAPGETSMRRLIDEGHAGTFDLVFIDANKDGYRAYWDLAHLLLRERGLVLADNTLFQGVVGDYWTDERLRRKWSARSHESRAQMIAATHAIRVFNQTAHHDERFAISMVPIGDGLTLGVRL